MQPTIAIVDVSDSPHGRAMHRCAQGDGFVAEIRWIEPSLQLPEILATLNDVGAVAIPLAVRGATREDRFTRRLMAAIADLVRRGIPVFVAAGNRRPNLLAEAGTAVSTAMYPGSAGTSEACVRAAVAAVHRSPRE
jgi:hypothetical protein